MEEEARAKEAEVILVEMSPRKNSGEEPPPPIAQLMAESNVVLCPTTKSLSHTQARRIASARGARIASIIPKSIHDACQAEMIFLAVPFPAYKDVAKQAKQWNGKIVVDVTNALHVAPGGLKGLLSSEVVSKAFVGARLVRPSLRPAASLRAQRRKDTPGNVSH